MCLIRPVGACVWSRFWTWVCGCTVFGNGIGTVFVSRTRDTSSNAYLYLRAVLTLERERNFKNMARRLDQWRATGKRCSTSCPLRPGTRAPSFEQIQTDLSAIPALRAGQRRDLG